VSVSWDIMEKWGGLISITKADPLSSANTQGLVDGGIAGLFWSYVWTFIGFGIVMMSLAEMASM
jgi:hypothetical protein